MLGLKRIIALEVFALTVAGLLMALLWPPFDTFLFALMVPISAMHGGMLYFVEREW